jgi:hypothetical protein
VIWLEYAPRRVACRRCGVKVERVPWAAHGVGFSYSLEEMVAYLAQVTDKTQVSRLRIGNCIAVVEWCGCGRQPFFGGLLVEMCDGCSSRGTRFRLSAWG